MLERTANETIERAIEHQLSHESGDRPIQLDVSASAPKKWTAPQPVGAAKVFASKYGFIVPIKVTQRAISTLVWESGHRTLFTTI